MQTFLPYKDFSECATVLDRQRLSKQRVEAMQILNILCGNTKESRWRNHPAVKMWRGYEIALGYYMNCMIWEWVHRGYKNTMEVARFSTGNVIWLPDSYQPPWLTDEFCLRHRSNLLRKNREYYLPIFGDIPDDLPYLWG